MILYTFYHFYIDLFNSLKTGSFIEGFTDVKDDDRSKFPGCGKCQVCTDNGERPGCSAAAIKAGVGKTGLDNHNGVQWCGGSTNSYLRACPPTKETIDAYNKVLSKGTTDDTDKNSQTPQTDMVDDYVPIGTAPGSGTGYSSVQDNSSGIDDSEELKLAKILFDMFQVPYDKTLSREQLINMIKMGEPAFDPEDKLNIIGLNMLDTNSDKEYDINEVQYLLKMGKENDKASEMTRVHRENPVVSSQPVEQSQSSITSSHTLPNGNILLSSTDKCPNGCSIPSYDNSKCENTIHNGKSYRQCPWTSIDSKIDCDKCGAVLLPKNEYGYAKTRIGYSDIRGLDIIAKRIEKERIISKIQVSKKNPSKSDFFNIGKEFLKQHGELKGYDIPNNITVKEYTLLGKILFIYLSNKTKKNQSNLKNYIEALYLEHYLNNKCDEGCENNAIKSIDKETKFTLDELKKRDAYAYVEGVIETGKDNRLGGSNTQFKNRTAYRSDYRPVNPRKFPHPYNSLWDIL